MREFRDADPLHVYKADVHISNPTHIPATFGWSKCGETMDYINLPRKYFLDDAGHKSVWNVNQAGNIILNTYNALLSNN